MNLVRTPRITPRGGPSVTALGDRLQSRLSQLRLQADMVPFWLPIKRRLYV